MHVDSGKVIKILITVSQRAAQVHVKTYINMHVGESIDLTRSLCLLIDFNGLV